MIVGFLYRIRGSCALRFLHETTRDSEACATDAAPACNGSGFFCHIRVAAAEVCIQGRAAVITGTGY